MNIKKEDFNFEVLFLCISSLLSGKESQNRIYAVYGIGAVKSRVNFYNNKLGGGVFGYRSGGAEERMVKSRNDLASDVCDRSVFCAEEAFKCAVKSSLEIFGKLCGVIFGIVSPTAEEAFAWWETVPDADTLFSNKERNDET